MKKYFSALAVIAVLVSCSKDETVTPPAVDNGKYIMTITVTNEPSRAGGDVDGLMNWEVGDQIGVFVGGEQNVPFYIQHIASNGTTATFTGTLSQEPASGSTYYAYYPYAPEVSMSGTAMNINMLTAQTQPLSGAIKFKELPMVGKYTGDATDVHFAFENLFTILKLTAQAPAGNAVTVSSLNFESGGTEIVAGNFNVDMTSASYTPSFARGLTHVSLKCQNSVTIPAGETADFFIAVPSVNYANGFRVTYYTLTGTQTLTRTSAIDFSAKQGFIYETPTFALNNIDINGITNLVDNNFKAFLLSEGYITTTDGSVNTSITAFTEKATSEVLLDIPTSATVHNLNVLRYFPNLQTLIVQYNQVSNVDLSALPNIMAVTLKGDFLNSIDLQYNTNLRVLTLSGNQNLNSVDFSNTPRLQILEIDGINGLQSLDLSNHSDLVSVSCVGNGNMHTLDLSGCSKLTKLYLTDTNTSVIDADQGTLNLTATPPQLQNLYLDNIKAEDRVWNTVDASNNDNLHALSLQWNTGLAGVTATGSDNIKVYVYNSPGANVTPADKAVADQRQ
ncbi:hypothetical protein [uncultured Alistipes sp.]|jgi:cell surface protein (putative penicillin-binding protein)|uniref:hypothetical protein n=1 Tax=uncultured Alistipes sp. TaxID=538949 RepID=UPI0025FD9FF7|nr:hypothetical protein [uncultured Alistipes sp.]